MSKQVQKRNNFCTQHVVTLYFLGNSMNNLFLCCGLTDARMRASEKKNMYLYFDDLTKIFFTVLSNTVFFEGTDTDCIKSNWTS